MLHSKYILLLSFPLWIACQNTETVEEEIATETNYCVDKKLKNSLGLEALEMRPMTETITLTGSVEYNDDKTIPFVSLVDGIVKNTYFTLGDYVKKGQVLANIESTSFNEIQGESAALSSQITLAKRNLLAIESMYKDGIASQKDLIEAQSELNVLQSTLKANQQNRQLYSGNSKGVIQIKAPADGYIVTKSINPGMSVSAGGDSLFTISNLNQVWVMANVYATDMGNVKAGQTVQVKTLAYPDEVFNGTIQAISQVFDAEERVLKARIVLGNQALKLKPGMSTDIVLQVDNKKSTALAIPNSALVFSNNQNYVVSYKGDCSMKIVAIESIFKNEHYTYVNSGAALKETDKVITNNELIVFEELKNRQ